MIRYPRGREEWERMARFLAAHAHVSPSESLRMMGWEADGELKMVVGFDGFIGAVATVHVAMAPGFTYTPRPMLDAFRGAFDTFGIRKMIGIVNSRNEKAMRYDLRLGFREEYRMPGLHDDGGDIVFLTLEREHGTRLLAA